MPEEADSAFDAVTRFMVEELMVDVRDLRKRVDGLLWLAASALLMDVILRLAGIQ
ncbi:MAG TPA: hypothetical protein PK691_11280 [Thermomicrobiales bacterium]|nr:hypothetical protein [Thermomicrobiales bacterium]